MNYRKIEKSSLITISILFVIFVFINSKYSLGLLLGGLASLFGLKMIEKLEYIDISEYKPLRGQLKKNHFIRIAVYAVVLLACFLRPNVFSIITCFVGLVLTKVWIVIIELKEAKES